MTNGRPENEMLARLLNSDADVVPMLDPGRKWNDGGTFANGKVRREVFEKDVRVVLELPDDNRRLTMLSTRGNYNQDTPAALILERDGMIVKTAKFVQTNFAHQDFKIVNSDGSNGGELSLQGASMEELNLRVVKSYYPSEPSLSDVGLGGGVGAVYRWVKG